jgi:enediyne biosynthesis protein E4
MFANQDEISSSPDWCLWRAYRIMIARGAAENAVGEETVVKGRIQGGWVALSLAALAAVSLPAILTGCRSRAGSASGGTAAHGPVQIVDVAPQAGVRFHHTSGESGRSFLAETMGSGCAFLDYDGDGRLDLFLVNSSRLPGFKQKGPFYPALYRNEGNSQFKDVTRQAGLAIDCYGMGVAVADYDNDGDPDLLLTSFGGSHLFRNDGGHFTEVTRQAGVTKPAWGTSAAWFDYDRDGWLDLFICNYLQWSPETNRVCGEHGLRYACPPAEYPSTASVLYHNNRDGTFSDVTHQAKVDRPNGKALGVVVWDMDDDGWPDFAVANDSQPNWLFRNNRDGTFSEIGVESGVAYGMQGRQRSGMGIDTGDYDLTGREAILIGNLSGEGLALYRPTEAAGQYADGAEEAGLFQASLPFTTFGARFFDYDLDGYPDLLTANGHVNEEVGATSGTFRYEQRLQLFHNEPGPDGRRHFQDVTATAGAALNQPRTGRGLAVGDFDGDGDPDVLVSSNAGAAALLRNEGPPHGHWLAVKLVGARSNREGIGARIRVTAGGRTRTGWVRSGGSYCSEDEHVARFGLGDLASAERVEVRWPDGTVEQRANVAANQVLLIREAGSRG